MLCGDAEVREKTPDLYFQFRNGGGYSLNENRCRFEMRFSFHGVFSV
jgi:hypothetical protein